MKCLLAARGCPMTATTGVWSALREVFDDVAPRTRRSGTRRTVILCADGQWHKAPRAGIRARPQAWRRLW